CRIIENRPEAWQLVPVRLASHANARLLCAAVIFSNQNNNAEDQTMQSKRSFLSLILILFAPLALSLGSDSIAQEAEPVKARYTKHEYQIAMRDGVKLFTSVYVPKDGSQKYPIMNQRTPYSVAPYGPDSYRGSLGPSPMFMDEGFIFVYQDVRGRNMSEGEFAWMRAHKPKKSSPTEADETTDTWDTIEWLIKNIPNNNGRVGIWGISYRAITPRRR